MSREGATVKYSSAAVKTDSSAQAIRPRFRSPSSGGQRIPNASRLRAEQVAAELIRLAEQNKTVVDRLAPPSLVARGAIS